ncbi:velvet protein [Pseudocyphellaria aurata]|nr:velvet protein [Pseudocyphellaria aurata]
MANIMAVSNETKSSKSRVTKEGRHLTYEMTVIQQPERARACGSGAKCSYHSQTPKRCLPVMLTRTNAASADRRPVDPPPVVELRIFEGEANKDITFAYNANFFLYTTLENARPIAQGRVPATQTSFPVLTGMPVAGMAYLDRPSQAGYFIFPDLSVRHEGKYRLSFNLFEEVKEARDGDAEPAAGSPESDENKPARNNPMAPQAHVHFRLEVKSVPFTVYSAKKFPGLAESTSLSRVVAEQGCRVRIRRDVRMRRRDTKSTKNYDDFEDEPTYAHSDRFATPDTFSKSQMPDRPRSISNGSMETPTGFTPDQRRASAQEMVYYGQGSFPQPQQPAPQPQSASSGYTSHLSFGSSGTQHYPVSAFQPPGAAVSQSAQSYIPTAGGFQYPATVHSRPLSNPQNGGYSQPQTQTQTQQPMYSQPQIYPENNDYRAMSDYRRPSLPVNHQANYSSQNVNGYGQVDNRQVALPQNYYHQTVQPPPPREVTPTNGHALPPLKTLQPPMEKKYEPTSPATAMPGGMIGIAPAFDGMQSKYSSYAAAGQATNPGTTPRTGKRAFGAVFNTDHLNQPMHSGMRPSSASHGQDVPQIEADDGSLEDEYDMQSLKMLAYRRADGSRQLKKCPSPVSE